MEIIKYPEKLVWQELLKRPYSDFSSVKDIVTKIIEEVKKDGDKALYKFISLYEKNSISDLRVSESEIIEAKNNIDYTLKKAIEVAKANIYKFHESQKIDDRVIETTEGVRCWRKSVPIEKVGLYVPGGSAPLFSTVLMLGIPAKIAGCGHIILCTPANKEGKVNPVILYTADLIGIKNIFKVGGAQAIAAMAYGTETISKVYKIFGPGNQYVTAAKQLVSQDGIAIDMLAGPSEVAVIADKSSNPEFVASDLLAQAEHGKDSQVFLFTCDESIIEPVLFQIEKQLNLLQRKDLAKASLSNSKIIVLKNYDEIMEMVNEYAPEHLILSSQNADNLIDKVINAGSVFIGNYTPESAGDYASGTNHTLPTGGQAKISGGVSVDSFVKKITFQKILENGLLKLGPHIEKMAEVEQLDAHKNSITYRLNHLKEK